MDELVRLEVELARMYLVANWQSTAKHEGSKWGYMKVTQQVHKNGYSYPQDGYAHQWHTLPQRLLAASPHLQGGDIPWDVVQELRDQGMGLVEALDLLGL